MCRGKSGEINYTILNSYINMAVAIIRQAYRDIEEPNPEIRQAAKEFLNSPYKKDLEALILDYFQIKRFSVIQNNVHFGKNKKRKKDGN